MDPTTLDGRGVAGGSAQPVVIVNASVPTTGGGGADPPTATKQDTANTSLASLGPHVVAAGDTANGTNAAAILTYAATASLKHVISGIHWSYNAAPTAGNLKIEDDGTTVFSIDITAAGPGFIPFPGGKKAVAVNKTMVVTLAAGGAGVVGRVNAQHWTEA